MMVALNLETSRRDVIVIGGSEGADVPLRKLLSELDESCQASIFIVLHLPPGGTVTGIEAIVASAAPGLPVVQATDNIPYHAGCIYLASADRHLILADGHIRLGAGPRENMMRPAIDPLFRSAAMVHGPRVIGVLLSGRLNDGSAGLAAIAQCGGTTIVQDPRDAIAQQMPANALQAVSADIVAEGARLGHLLSDLSLEPAGWPRPVPPELKLEVAIALGERIDSSLLPQLAEPSPLTCPACGGVMSTMQGPGPLRFRCQVGHAMTAQVMAKEQEGAVDEALRVALRVIEERAELISRMAREASSQGRTGTTASYEARAHEYRNYADTLRRAVMHSMGVEADSAATNAAAVGAIGDDSADR